MKFIRKSKFKPIQFATTMKSKNCIAYKYFTLTLLDKKDGWCPNNWYLSAVYWLFEINIVQQFQFFLLLQSFHFRNEKYSSFWFILNTFIFLSKYWARLIKKIIYIFSCFSRNGNWRMLKQNAIDAKINFTINWSSFEQNMMIWLNY